MQGSSQLNAKMRALGFEVSVPDISMFTLGGDGVHCLSQAMCRDTAQDSIRKFAGLMSLVRIALNEWLPVQFRPFVASLHLSIERHSDLDRCLDAHLRTRSRP